MFKNIISGIEGMGFWSIIGMISFFVLFIMIIIRTLKMDHKFIDHMSDLPLDKDQMKIKGEQR